MALSSLKKEVYVLRDWWMWLDFNKKRWNEASDQLMSDWREAMKDRGQHSDEHISDQRIHDKCHTVFTFYDKLPAIMDLPQNFVGPNGPIRPVVEPRFGHMGVRNSAKQWALNEGYVRNTVRRKVPDEILVQKVLTSLRNTSKNPDINDRNWLIGRVMAEAGLRRVEVSRLDEKMIEQGLRDERLISLQKTKSLADIEDRQERESILRTLEQLHLQKHRENIWIKIKGKRDVIRETPFPIELVKDLLIFGIWGARRNQIIRWRSSSPKLQIASNIFLSSHKKPMGAGAIGNLVKQAFTSNNSNLSGHRLRAFFATTMAIKLWSEAYAQNNFRWDQTVENLVLEQVARALGHKKIDTTVRYYVSLAQMNYFGMPTKSKLKELRKATKGLSALDKSGIEVISITIKRLLQVGTNSPFFQAIQMLLDHPDMQPSYEEKEKFKDIQHWNDAKLRLVPKSPPTNA